MQYAVWAEGTAVFSHRRFSFSFFFPLAIITNALKAKNYCSERERESSVKRAQHLGRIRLTTFSLELRLRFLSSSFIYFLFVRDHQWGFLYSDCVCSCFFFCFFVVPLRSFLFCHCVTLRDLKDTLQFFFFFVFFCSACPCRDNIWRNAVCRSNLERYTQPSFLF